MTTIFALSSGRPPAAIAVVRISGPDAHSAAVALAGTLPAPRHASLRTLRDAQGETLDRALVLWFPGPRSATGEDLVEFHLHGGPAVVEAVTDTLGTIPNLRIAKPGEFTRRALEHGRVDLAQAEGLADLLAAESQNARRVALAAAEGMLSRRVSGWLERLSDISARLEAAIDYAEEGEVGEGTIDTVPSTIASLRDELAHALSQPSVERLKDGTLVVLAGPPNAGKSSLFNALIQRDAAIVSPISGTTRDAIEAVVQRGGAAYRLVDTAGLIETSEPIERIGVARAHALLEQADLILWLGDAEDIPERGMLIRAKVDAEDEATTAVGVPVSVFRDETITALWHVIDQRCHPLTNWDRVAFSAHQRHSISRALADLEAAIVAPDELMMVEHIRLSQRSLAEVVGVDPSEAMLDALFSRFCLGK